MPRARTPAGGTLVSGALAALLLAGPLPAQVVTGGAGVLLSDGPATPVAELHAAAPPLAGIRPYLTLSWTDEDLHPTAITAAENTVLRTPASTTGLGAGLLWIEDDGYRAHSMLVSPTVVPLPIPGRRPWPSARPSPSRTSAGRLSSRSG